MSPNVSSSYPSIITRIFSSSNAVKQIVLKRKRQEDEEIEQSFVLKAMRKEDNTEPRLPPSWEVLCLVGLYMDPETIAVASCVSTTWSTCFSSDNLWRTLFIARSTQRSCPFGIALEFMEGVTYKQFVTGVESDAKRRRKNQLPEPKISLSDLVFFVHVSTETKSVSVCKRGKDLVFGSNDDKFEIEVDVSNSGITFGEKDVKMTWQVVYRAWEKFFTMADTTRSLHTKYGWFTEDLEAKDDRKVLGDVKTSFNGDLLKKVGFSVVDSNWGSLSVNNVMRYAERFLV